ncbi:phosphoribosylformylglycinamidine synthase subunit PurS [Sediminibacillus halophilus]|uniref:Phosphoribosylformylglycinamidine synthase subunit PurS n=1 Tax=Sediminibacillus halophilus TaxID=482461 RepID=A0A1G9V2N8_9BACI|nr:phosphoribosylformylglycinamidine synthase subunit PurS [Sediminibacillus halophilus]SDM66363.1 phosphoribosylformylglycinamidine synthase [Sediminibacillus halophilus]
MKTVKIFITLKHGVLDPQGKAVQESLNKLGFPEVKGARVGKYMELQLDDHADIDQQIKEMCAKLLANPVIEDYQYTIEEGAVQ